MQLHSYKNNIIAIYIARHIHRCADVLFLRGREHCFSAYGNHFHSIHAMPCHQFLRRLLIRSRFTDITYLFLSWTSWSTALCHVWRQQKKKHTFKRVLMWMFAVRSWPFHSIPDLHFDKSALHTSISHIASNLQHGRFSSSLWLMKFIQKGIASNWKRGTKWKRATHCALSSMRWWKHVGRLQPSTPKKNILVYI